MLRLQCSLLCYHAFLWASMQFSRNLICIFSIFKHWAANSKYFNNECQMCIDLYAGVMWARPVGVMWTYVHITQVIGTVGTFDCVA